MVGCGLLLGVCKVEGEVGNASLVATPDTEFIANQVNNQLMGLAMVDVAVPGTRTAGLAFSQGSKAAGLFDKAAGKFASLESATTHFQKHAHEFGFSALDEYVSAAGKFAESAQAEGASVLTKVRANGDIVLYNPATNEFAVATSDGTIRTYFLPDPSIHGYESNLAYFEAQ